MISIFTYDIYLITTVDMIIVDDAINPSTTMVAMAIADGISGSALPYRFLIHITTIV